MQERAFGPLDVHVCIFFSDRYGLRKIKQNPKRNQNKAAKQSKIQISTVRIKISKTVWIL